MLTVHPIAVEAPPARVEPAPKSAQSCVGPCAPVGPEQLAVACQNIRMMHALEQLALRFNHAGIPLMLLKGAALQLCAYEFPHERSMRDLDVLVHPQHVRSALELLEQAGWRRWRCFVREDFFPRYYFEVEYTIGQVFPVMLDLHVRPFRALRYVKLMPENAFWSRAREQALGQASVLLPSRQDMLIHLCAHYAFHGEDRHKWTQDIGRWIDLHGPELHWGDLLQRASQWRLNLAVRRGLEAAEADLARPLIGDDVRRRLGAAPVNWRDRLVLAQAPRDEKHPAAHLLVTLLTTPDPRLALGFLRATLLPDAAHMREWYGRSHRGWLLAAHLLRLAQPLTRRLARLWPWRAWAVEPGEDGRPRLVARRTLRPGQRIGRYRVRAADPQDRRAVVHEYDDGSAARWSIRGPLRYALDDQEPNARLRELEVLALRRIEPHEPITLAPQRRTRMPGTAPIPPATQAAGECCR